MHLLVANNTINTWENKIDVLIVAIILVAIGLPVSIRSHQHSTHWLLEVHTDYHSRSCQSELGMLVLLWHSHNTAVYLNPSLHHNTACCIHHVMYLQSVIKTLALDHISHIEMSDSYNIMWIGALLPY